MSKFSRSTSPAGENILAVEFTCSEKNALWKATKEELFELSIGTLAEDGFLSKENVKGLIMIKTPYAYPIYRKDYAGHLKRLLDYVNNYRDITVLGRCGEFIYMDVDKCIRRSFDCAKGLLKKYKNQKVTEPAETRMV
jgi:protoporphyrinogen oxidase